MFGLENPDRGGREAKKVGEGSEKLEALAGRLNYKEEAEVLGTKQAAEKDRDRMQLPEGVLA